MKAFKFFILFFITLTLVVCTIKTKDNILRTNLKSSITYAKGFDIITENNQKKLLIYTPYKNAKTQQEYILRTKKSQNTSKKSIKIPVTNFVATSTTHIPMIELLEQEHALIGFPFTNYVSSKKTRALIDKGLIKEIGKQDALNTEVLLDLQPNLIIGYSLNSTNKTLNTLEKAGIPVIYNGDWLEETPLGRAEWIKFFGVLFNKEQQADSIFKVIEHNYLEAKTIANQNQTNISVLSGAIMSKDIWSLPAGDSFVAQFLKDANVNYLWQHTTGKGSLALSFESVFNKGKTADFWLSPGYFTSKNQLLESNSLYKKFNAFNNNTIYSPAVKQGATGGVLYYELAPTRPDLVLKDIIKITQPKLLPNYSLTFFEILK